MTECSYFDRAQCRSCSLLSVSPELRNTGKLNGLSQLVERELGAGIPIAPLWKPRQIFPSRTKAKLSVSGTARDPVIGLMGGESAGFAGTELLDCPLHLPEINRVLHEVKRAIVREGLTPYDVAARTGELKGLIVKSSESGQELLLRFVLRSELLVEKVRKAAQEIQATLQYVRVVSANLQPIPHAILEGEREILLTECGLIWENFEGFSLAFAPQSFSQVTHETAQALYAHVRECLARAPASGLLDLYCGVGGFSFAAAPHVEWSHGVEISAQAIECAELGRAKNGALQATFTAGDAEAFLRSYQGAPPEVILINPPRRGISAAMVSEIVRLGPRRILYSSCNPVTLMRDLGLLRGTYSVTGLAPFDMFPLTEHLEVVAELGLK